jgi:hypothetical protein
MLALPLTPRFLHLVLHSPESTDEIAADPDVWPRGYMRGAFSHSGGDIWDCLVMILSLDLTVFFNW